MKPEDELRQAFEARAEEVETSPDALGRIIERTETTTMWWQRNPLPLLAGAAALVLIVAIGAVLLTRGGDGEPEAVQTADDPDAPVDPSPTTEADATPEPSEPEVSPEPEATPDPPQPEETAEPQGTSTPEPTAEPTPEPPAASVAPPVLVIAPAGPPETWPTSAEEMLRQFVDELNAGTELPLPLSDEVVVDDLIAFGTLLGVPENPDAPPRTVANIRLEAGREDDGTERWAVVAVASPDIVITDPTPGAVVTSPLTVRGSGNAFEANIGLLIEDDSTGDLAVGNAMGGSFGENEPFEGTLTWTEDVEGDGGFVIGFAQSAANGTPESLTIVPVMFGPAAPPPSGPCAVAPPSTVPGERIVSLWYSCTEIEGFPSRDALLEIERVIPDTEGLLAATLEQLVAGPTTAEQAAGFSSGWNPATADIIQSVDVGGNRAVVDLIAAAPSLMPTGSASAGSVDMFGAMTNTVFQFPSIDELEIRFNGDCEAFGEWSQAGGCPIFTRP